MHTAEQRKQCKMKTREKKKSELALDEGRPCYTVRKNARMDGMCLPTSTKTLSLLLHTLSQPTIIPVLLTRILHSSSVDLRVGAPGGLSAAVPRGFLGRT